MWMATQQIANYFFFFFSFSEDAAEPIHNLFCAISGSGMDGIGWDWISLGGVRYKAAFGANNDKYWFDKYLV